jgi:hypothetical protein
MSLLRYQVSKKRRAQTRLELRARCRSFDPASRTDEIASATRLHKGAS